MKSLCRFAYNCFLLPLMWTAIQLLALFKAKVRRGIRGRRSLFPSLETQVAHKLPPGKRIWFHASSMGEFEQAKPIIAELKRQHDDVRIIATFFSPSGYEHSKKYPLADVISYIPIDTIGNARRFLDLTRPDVAVIIRYDVWPNHIWELEKRNIPMVIANATMRHNTLRRYLLVRHFHYFVYNAISNILTVSESDVKAFGVFKLDRPHIEAIGDTRYDQVSNRSAEAQKRHIISETILRGKRVIVAGSSWPEDEEVLIPAFLQLQSEGNNLLLIIVPHEPTVEHLEELESTLTGTTSFIRFSGLNDYSGEHVIIVDSIGILLALYTCAHIAYIGGSFKQNVHNVLEAAVYGIPVVYGPRHRNSQEAIRLAELGGGFVVDGVESMKNTFRRLLDDEAARTTSGKTAAAFVQQNVGATERFLKYLERYL
ncbi:MAG: 3-deoxy-D-manno-octulosonic acid transferase [Ignavibacteriae bacterium]|nr:3-deoxy-D-manno-octulosonic acid transferase [Ignavibacteriota bacterium]